MIFVSVLLLSLALPSSFSSSSSGSSSSIFAPCFSNMQYTYAGSSVLPLITTEVLVVEEDGLNFHFIWVSSVVFTWVIFGEPNCSFVMELTSEEYF